MSKDAVMNNEFFKSAADNLMISDNDDRTHGRPFALLTLYEGELLTLRFDKDSTLMTTVVSSTIDTGLITDTKWLPISSNKHIGDIMKQFAGSHVTSKFTDVVKLNKPFKCAHIAYISNYGDEEVKLKKFVERLGILKEEDIKSILTSSCFRSKVTLNDIMFWEER
ncbi:hypothetical protein NIGALANA_155 [Bacillus phage Nigalana]|nr:hypothetical protein BI005_gp155 [Bacillus phage Nigalana]AMW61305.1 hypothetical protein NIGALANA_155 [Bacillus phage Nigalana]